MTDRETLIEEAAAVLRNYGYGHLADVVEAVFEKALGEATVTQTDDEREALDYAIRVPIAARHVDHKPLWELIRAIQDSVLAAGFRRSEVPETSAQVACPHWAEGKITMRKGCTACAAEGREPQGEPSDAQVQAAWEALNEIHDTGSEAMRAALCAAWDVR